MIIYYQRWNAEHIIKCQIISGKKSLFLLIKINTGMPSFLLLFWSGRAVPLLELSWSRSIRNLSPVSHSLDFIYWSTSQNTLADLFSYYHIWFPPSYHRTWFATMYVNSHAIYWFSSKILTFSQEYSLYFVCSVNLLCIEFLRAFCHCWVLAIILISN